MLQVGAGTGLLFILRWFWWRINALSEVVAMVVSFVVAVTLKLGNFGLASWQELLVGVGITTTCWLSAAVLTPPAGARTLQSFCARINPGGPGWRVVYRQLEASGRAPVGSGVNIPRGILCMVLGCAAVYGVLFGTGFFIYGEMISAIILLVISFAAAAGIVALRFAD
jgi:hypothetical protein